ncbi:MAG: iron-containing redox enzyme family protein [Myxococcaceae bacterium]|nr:iron-containing redox enzyme family protein [Myxococcaceae bacterium]
MSHPLDVFVQALKARLAPLDGPYFHALRDGSFSREDFVETQVQFAHAVFFFSRPMMVLAARVSNPSVRLPLLANVTDEHGEGDLSMSHEATFTRFLERLGVERDAPWQRPLWPEVRAFNTVLAGVCTLDDVPTAMATLGIIEDLFAGISAAIGRAVVDRGFLSADALVHYTTHEALDELHAEGFYAPLRERFSADETFRYQVQQGLELGANVFLGLYRGLYESRARRDRREARGPHSVVAGFE